jgi:hypothetical protein
MSRLFTREEANAFLPHIAPLLWELQRLNEKLMAASRQLADLQATMSGNGHGLDVGMARARSEQAQTTLEISSMIEKITTMGVEVKDLDQGLIDFRSEMKGRVVYLCWKLGEENIGWWHELDIGFAGRQPLDQ